MKLIKFYFFLMIILISCDNCETTHIKPKLDEKWLNIDLFLKKEKVHKDYGGFFGSFDQINSYYEETDWNSIKAKTMFTDKYEFTYFDSNYKHIEIFYRKPIFFKPDFKSNNIYNAIICMDTIKKKAFYILWFNNKKQDKYEETDIGKTTDSVFTNIDYNDFIKLYPEFKGKFHFNIVKRIDVGDNYEIYETKFYHSIRFVGFDERYYQMYPDSGENKLVIPIYK